MILPFLMFWPVGSEFLVHSEEAFDGARFDFYFKVNSGIANIHFTLAKLTSADQSGTKGGYDPLTIGIIVAVVIAGVLAIVLIALRIRKKSGLPPPPPPPPPPGSAR